MRTLSSTGLMSRIAKKITLPRSSYGGFMSTRQNSRSDESSQREVWPETTYPGLRHFLSGLPLLLLLSGLVLGGCDRAQQSPQPRPAPQVSFVAMQPEKITLTTELPGRTSPFRVAEIRPQVSGLILKRLFQEGSLVTAGQVLYQTFDTFSFCMIQECCPRC